jgi:hypothetical protein
MKLPATWGEIKDVDRQPTGRKPFQRFFRHRSPAATLVGTWSPRRRGNAGGFIFMKKSRKDDRLYA